MKTETVRHTPGAARLDRELANAHGYLVDAREALLKQSETFESETALYAIADADKAIQRAGELESGLPDLLAAAEAILKRNTRLHPLEAFANPEEWICIPKEDFDKLCAAIAKVEVAHV